MSLKYLVQNATSHPVSYQREVNAENGSHGAHDDPNPHFGLQQAQSEPRTHRASTPVCTHGEEQEIQHPTAYSDKRGKQAYAWQCHQDLKFDDESTDGIHRHLANLDEHLHTAQQPTTTTLRVRPHMHNHACITPVQYCTNEQDAGR